MIQIRQITNPLDPAIGKFGKLQRQVYFEADMLIPPTVIRAILGLGVAGRSNFLVVAEEAGEVLGGTFFHYLKQPNSGFSSFMGIAVQARGQGITRKLHQARFEVLDKAAGGAVNGIFIDVVDPERMSAEELEEERQVNSDPVHRRQAFQALGFRKVNLRYEQPVGGPGGGPVTNMDLLYCPRQPGDSIPTALVLETMQAYWSPWLGASRAKREVDKLRKRAGGEALALLSAV